MLILSCTAFSESVISQPPLKVTIPPHYESTDQSEEKRRDRDSKSDRSGSGSSNTTSPVASNNQSPFIQPPVNPTPSQKALSESLNVDGGFTKIAIDSQGKLNFSILSDFKPYAAPTTYAGFFWSNDFSGRANHYVTVHYIGTNNDLTDALALLKSRINELLPIYNIDQTSPKEIKLGEKYQLIYAGIKRVPPTKLYVTVTEITPISFTLTAVPGQIFQGSVTHGIITDSNGVVWLFQEGIGQKSENQIIDTLTNHIANHMWTRMTKHMTDILFNKNQNRNYTPNGIDRK